MDLSRLGLVLLDQQGRVVFSNAPARELIPSLQELVTVSETWSGPLPVSGEAVEAQFGDQPIRIRLCNTWLSNGKSGNGYSGLLIEPRGQSRDKRRAQLVQKLRLTPAEVRLAEVLLTGLRPDEAARELGVTLHTVRTYVKRLYRRVGVNSMGALICALNRAVE